MAGQGRGSRILVVAPMSAISSYSSSSSFSSSSHLSNAQLKRLVQTIIPSGEEGSPSFSPISTIQDPDGSSSFVYQSSSSSKEKEREGEEDEEEGESQLISWLISNRYYSARIHFKTLCLNVLRSVKRQVGKNPKGVIRPRRDEPTLPEEEGDKVRDVFRALERESSMNGKSAGAEQAKGALSMQRRCLKEELSGVDAVVLAVDRSSNPSIHKELIDILEGNEVGGLSGFDLAVSLVVGLPSLNVAQTESSHGSAREQLVDLYAEHGWEYIDLLDEEALEEPVEEEDGGDGEEEQSLGQGEEQGIGRVREALQAHMWPGLVRNNDRQRRVPMEEMEEKPLTRLSFPQGRGFSEWPVGDDLVEEAQALEDNVMEKLATFDLGGLPRDHVPVEPTAEDEALAETFLRRIQEAESSGKLLQRNIHQELEDFLQSEDQESERLEQDNKEVAWGAPTRGQGSKPTGQFDDDFADFVEAPRSNAPRDESIPSLEDVLSSRTALAALERRLESHDDDEGMGQRQPEVDFGATLSAIQAHAERVRSIKDVDTRREEAAKVALSLAKST